MFPFVQQLEISNCNDVTWYTRSPRCCHMAKPDELGNSTIHQLAAWKVQSEAIRNINKRNMTIDSTHVVWNLHWSSTVSKTLHKDVPSVHKNQPREYILFPNSISFNVFAGRVSLSTCRKPFDFAAAALKIDFEGVQWSMRCACMTYGLTALSPEKETEEGKFL